MATMDLMERLGFSRPAEDAEDEIPEVPDDARELLEDDDQEEDLPKDPPAARKKSRTVRMPEGKVKATAAEKRQVKDAMALIVKVPAGIWAMRDPHCGTALQEQADDIIKAAVPIICRNPTMLRWFTATNAPWLDMVALISAFGPFIATVWGHHVTHTVGELPQDGGQGVDLSSYAVPAWND